MRHVERKRERRRAYRELEAAYFGDIDWLDFEFSEFAEIPGPYADFDPDPDMPTWALSDLSVIWLRDEAEIQRRRAVAALVDAEY